MPSEEQIRLHRDYLQIATKSPKVKVTLGINTRKLKKGRIS
jgi:hypothetical protein